MASTPNYADVLKAVSSWPPEDRLAFAQDVLGTLRADVSKPRPRKQTLERALGLARGDGPPPSDDEVKRWIEEHRWEKYGR